MRIFEDIIDNQQLTSDSTAMKIIKDGKSGNMNRTPEQWYSEAKKSGYEQMLVLTVSDPSEDDVDFLSEIIWKTVHYFYKDCSDVQAVSARDNEYADYPNLVYEQTARTDFDGNRISDGQIIDIGDVDYTPVCFKIAFRDNSKDPKAEIIKFMKAVAAVVKCGCIRPFNNVTVDGYRREWNSWTLYFNDFNEWNYDYSWQLYTLFSSPSESSMAEICQDDEEDLFYQIKYQLNNVSVNLVRETIREYINQHINSFE